MTLFQKKMYWLFDPKIGSEFDQEIPQSQTADNPIAPRTPGTKGVFGQKMCLHGALCSIIFNKM